MLPYQKELLIESVELNIELVTDKVNRVVKNDALKQLYELKIKDLKMILDIVKKEIK